MFKDSITSPARMIERNREMAAAERPEMVCKLNVIHCHPKLPIRRSLQKISCDFKG